MTEYEAFVAENLEGTNERCGFYSLDDMEKQSFSPLNVVILRQITKPASYPLGIDDELFSQRKPDKGLITKRKSGY